MARLANYAQIIKQVLGQYIDTIPPQENLELICITDDANGHYMVAEIGWRHPRRIYSIACHIRLKSDKVWIEHDRTPYGIAQDLVNAGIPKDEIVLAFHHSTIRPLTEFAVA